jgi:2-haloacid dehalogenase
MVRGNRDLRRRGVNKPDRRIFDHLAEQFGIEPAAALFVDDSSENVDAAGALGFRVIQFTDAPTLRRELVRLGLLPTTQAKPPPG